MPADERGDRIAHQGAGHAVRIELEDGLDESLPRPPAHKRIFLHRPCGAVRVNVCMGAEDAQGNPGLARFAKDQVKRMQMVKEIVRFPQRVYAGDDDRAHAPLLHRPVEGMGVRIRRNACAARAKGAKQRLRV